MGEVEAGRLCMKENLMLYIISFLAFYSQGLYRLVPIGNEWVSLR